MDTSNHVKVEAPDGRNVTVAPEFAGFVRAVLDYGIDIADVFPDEDDVDRLSLVFLSEEDANSFAGCLLGEVMTSGGKDPLVHGHIMYSKEEFEGEEEVGVTIFMDLRRELLGSVTAMFALLAARDSVPAPADAAWDGNIVSFMPEMDRVSVGGRVMLAFHSHSPHWVERIWVTVVSVDGLFLTGEVEEDAKELVNVKKGESVRFFRHQVLACDPPRVSVENLN